MNKGHSDSDTCIKSIMYCQPRPKEKIASEGIHTLSAEQTQEQCRPTIILTDDLLWNYTGFSDSRLTSDYSDINGERMDHHLVNYMQIQYKGLRDAISDKTSIQLFYQGIYKSALKELPPLGRISPP